MVAQALSPSEIAQQVTTVDVPGYTVSIGYGLLDQVGRIAGQVAKAHRYAVVTDSTVGPLYAARVVAQFPAKAARSFTIPAGEAHKNRDTWASITDQLLDAGYGRDTTIIALGGGVVGDLAGFVAATFMRGVPFIQVPTTLLAMIDASIGGKTGVDTPAGKNLVGAFHPPAAVVVDPQVLDTLSLSELRAGLAEAIKHGVIADAEYFSFLGEAAGRLLRPNPAERDHGYIAALIHRSVAIKADVVRRDEREQGVRKILNFGHTIGHAIELLSGFSLSHGEAISMGMVLESQAAERAGIAEPGTTGRIVKALTLAGLPTARPLSQSPNRIFDVMRGDKKSRAGAIEYAVPTRIGAMAGESTGYGVRLNDPLVAEVLG